MRYVRRCLPAGYLEASSENLGPVRLLENGKTLKKEHRHIPDKVSHCGGVRKAREVW